MAPRAEEGGPGAAAEIVEYELDELKERIEGLQGSRLNLLSGVLGPLRLRSGGERFPGCLIIDPVDNQLWRYTCSQSQGDGSKTERFRDKMKDLIKFMNRNKLGKDIRDQIKGHVRLQYEISYTEASVLQDIPASIRAKISQSLYRPYIENVPLFKGCSSEFIHQIAIRLHKEFFLPGEVIIEQGNAVDQLYFVYHGVLEVIGIGEDGSEETILQLKSNSSFGEIAILCNIPHPYTVRVCRLCKLLRLDKQLFKNILEIYFVDGRVILNNLLEGDEYNIQIKQLESDITYFIGKHEVELALKVNSAAFNGDLYRLKGLIHAGADPKNTDYDGRSPLV